MSSRISASWLLPSRLGPQAFEETVAAFEVHGEAPADRGVSQSGGQEGLADTEWSVFSKPFQLDRVVVTWDKKLRERLVKPGPLTTDARASTHRRPAEALPPR
jgi:hypothetical protein